MGHGLTRGIFYIMEKCFDYGLFPCKSVTWFVVSLMFGTAGFYHINSEAIKPILVIHPIAAGTVSLPNTDTTDEPPVGMKMTSIHGEVVFERHCGDEVDSFWYALDVFIPLLDLKQEDKCSITTRDDEIVWRVLSNLFEILGAIVTPIMLLSVSGLLRRYIED